MLLSLLFKAFGLLPGFFRLEPLGLAFGLGLGELERLLPLEKVESDVGHGRRAAGSTEVIDAPE